MNGRMQTEKFKKNRFDEGIIPENQRFARVVFDFSTLMLQNIENSIEQQKSNDSWFIQYFGKTQFKYLNEMFNWEI